MNQLPAQPRDHQHRRRIALPQALLADVDPSRPMKHLFHTASSLPPHYTNNDG